MLRFSSLYPGVQFRAHLTCNFFIWKVEVTVISLKVTEKLNTARLCHMELLFLWIKRGEHWQLRVIQQMLIKCQPVSSTMCPQRNVIPCSPITDVWVESTKATKTRTWTRLRGAGPQTVTRSWPKLPLPPFKVLPYSTPTFPSLL